MTAHKILIVTYNWPPRNAIGAHRPYAWAKKWAENGAEVTILTAKKYVFDAPLDLRLPLLRNVRVIEVPYLPVGVGSGSSIAPLRAGLRWAKRIMNRFKNVDIRGKWSDAALAAMSKLSQEFDVVVSTHGPSAVHMIAAGMKRSNPEMHWIADYRDLWSQNHMSGWSPRVRRKEAAIELATVGCHASVVTTISSELAVQLGEFLGREVAVVMNGFDLEDDEVVSNIESRINLVKTVHPIRIVYTGMIYPGRRDPSPLFEALAELRRRDRIDPSVIGVEFYGARNEGVLKLVERFNVSEFVTIHGQVDRDQALQAQQNADLLLLLESGASDNIGSVTGKIFEYIAAGTPILSLGSRPESAIGQVLSATGCGMCFGENIEAIEQELKNLMLNPVPAWYRPSLPAVLEYSRSKQAETMYNDILIPLCK